MVSRAGCRPVHRQSSTAWATIHRLRTRGGTHECPGAEPSPNQAGNLTPRCSECQSNPDRQGRDLPSGTIPFGPQAGRQVYQTLGAHSNCVVHQEGPYRITAPPGKYRILTQFRPGNWTSGSVSTTVVDLEVLPGLPGIGSSTSAAWDATTASVEADLTGVVPSEPDPGGGGGGGGDDPNPCGPNLICTV